MITDLIVFFCIVIYGIIGVVTTGKCYLLLHKCVASDTIRVSSSNIPSNSTLAGLFWPIGLWFMFAYSVMLKHEKRETKKKLYEEETEKFLAAARKELDLL